MRSKPIAIVVDIILLAMGVRAGLLIGSSIIFSILGTFVIMLVIGEALHRTSLAALIIAMGMLVDNEKGNSPNKGPYRWSYHTTMGFIWSDHHCYWFIPAAVYGAGKCCRDYKTIVYRTGNFLNT